MHVSAPLSSPPRTRPNSTWAPPAGAGLELVDATTAQERLSAAAKASSADSYDYDSYPKQWPRCIGACQAGKCRLNPPKTGCCLLSDTDEQPAKSVHRHHQVEAGATVRNGRVGQEEELYRDREAGSPLDDYYNEERDGYGAPHDGYDDNPERRSGYGSEYHNGYGYEKKGTSVTIEYGNYICTYHRSGY